MRIKFKVIEFKSISPLFEWERDGEMPFTVRKIDYSDPRFRALAQWDPIFLKKERSPRWLIKLVNPATSEYFYRKLIFKRHFPGPSISGWPMMDKWLVLYLGKEIKEE